MTEQEKQLVLIDLCARLPYGVKLTTDYTNRKTIYILRQIFIGNFEPLAEVYTADDSALMDRYNVSALIPYLRPMSSMTREEYEEIWRICDFRTSSDDYDVFDRYGIQIVQEINNNKGNHQDRELDFSDYEDLTDFLNSHHFDYRGLIEKGLAIEAPEGMYNN